MLVFNVALLCVPEATNHVPPWCATSTRCAASVVWRTETLEGLSCSTSVPGGAVRGSPGLRIADASASTDTPTRVEPGRRHLSSAAARLPCSCAASAAPARSCACAPPA